MHTRPPRHGEKGASLIEFAVTLPVLLLLVIGMMRFGMAYNNQIILTDAARAGARQLSISRSVGADICNTAGVKVRNAALTLVSGSLTMTMRVNGTDYTAAAGSLPACNSAGSSMTLGADVTMTVSYPCNLSVLGITFGPNTCTVGSSTTARVE